MSQRVQREQRRAERAALKAKAIELLRTEPTSVVADATGLSPETLRWWRYVAGIQPVIKAPARVRPEAP